MAVYDVISLIKWIDAYGNCIVYLLDESKVEMEHAYHLTNVAISN